MKLFHHSFFCSLFNCTFCLMINGVFDQNFLKQLLDYCSFLIIPMRANTKTQGWNSQISQYRQSLSMLSSQLIRNSLSIDSGCPNIYRESLGAQLRPRNSIAFEVIEYLRQEFQHERQEKDKASFSNLRSTLNHLQSKICEAKKHFDTGRNSITNQILEEEAAAPQSYNQKTLTLEGELNTTLSSSGKIQYSTKEINSNSQSRKISGYYLSNLADVLQGRDERALDHMHFSLRVLKNYYKLTSPTFADIQEKKVYLPRSKTHAGKKTLILDIDQTLIHCEEDPSKPYDIAVPIEIENKTKANAYITIRPYAISFLKRMSKYFQIMAFTASHESYADAVLDEIDPEREYIKHRLYRKHCIQIYDKIFVKDLRVINRDLSSIVLVDNAPYSYAFQLENGIPILPYYSGEDVELMQLQKYLQGLVECEDVREFNKRHFQLHRYCNFDDSEQLIKELYL